MFSKIFFLLQDHEIIHSEASKTEYIDFINDKLSYPKTIKKFDNKVVIKNIEEEIIQEYLMRLLIHKKHIYLETNSKLLSIHVRDTVLPRF